MRLLRSAVVPCVLIVAAVAAGLWAVTTGGIDEWSPTMTDDPALVAAARTLLDELPDSAVAKRDPYGTACGMRHVDYCASSPTLTPAALRDATAAQLVAHGARLEHSDCEKQAIFVSYCRVYFSYRGAQIGIGARDVGFALPDGGEEKLPAYVWAEIMRATPPDEPFAPPLGPWRDLGVVPAGWADVPCAGSNDDGCVKYLGAVGGTGSADSARQALRRQLQSAGYRIDMDGCRTLKSGAQSCNVNASKFRALGGTQQVTVFGLLRSTAAAPNVFTGSVGAVAEHALINQPTPQPTVASPA